MRRVAILTAVALSGLTISGSALAANIIDQADFTNNAYMAAFSQSDLAQSFQQSVGDISGAGIFLQPGQGVGDTDITISLWDALPNNAGTQLASSTATTSTNGFWFDVFWAPVAITANQTYYLVFTSTVGSYGISGDTNNNYSGGNVFANSGFGSFPGYDYTFRTYADDAFGGGTGGVPEPATWAMMLMGFGGLGAVIRRRRGQVAITG